MADLTKEPPPTPAPPPPIQKTMQPIEVKIEDSEGSNTAQPSVLPSCGGGETNVERAAKREAHVLARIAELRKNGLWSNSRLPKCVEPERNKTHWDYLLEEVKWMAVDFRTETNTKRKIAKVIAHAIAKQHRDKQIEIERAAEREIKEKRKMCAGIAKMVRDFWSSTDKVVDIRAKEVLESRLRKARNKHLMFVIGQVDEMSNIVQEGLVSSSKSPSIASDRDDKDEEFKAPGSDSESDDEQTIANAEKSQKKEDVRQEVDALQNEATVDMDDFLYTLPPEYLKAYGLTQEDLEEMKREKLEEQKARKEACGDNEEKMEIDESPSSDAQKPSTSSSDLTAEQLQDPTAEDGNGDGHGVLENVDYVKLNSQDSDERQQELANIAEEALKFQPKGYTLETTQVKTPVPFLIRGQLREYQMVGLDWMVTLYEKNLNGILADEMGLGKTIQTISLLAHMACSESIWGPHLIVVPTSVILNWEMEFKKWCPALKILTYFGTAKERAEKRKGWMKPNCFHVCITSYKTVTQDIRAFKQRAWQYLILDEAQNIKNWKSQRWQALLNVRARRRLLLTGTPLQNSLMELWSLMHFLMPTIFSSHDDFKDWFSNPLTGMMEGNMEFNAPLIGRLHKVLRPFILRRLKKEVEKQLPEKTEHIVNCSLSKRQRYLYDDFMSRRSTKENLKSGNMMSVLNIVMQLRKCCNHPNLFEPRPVVAPFVVEKLQLDVPARLFEISQQDPSSSSASQIPEIFNLSKIGYQSSVRSAKPLIEELEAMSTYPEPRAPEVGGFRFNRTAFVAKNPHTEESEDEGVMRSRVLPKPINGTAQPLQNGNSIPQNAPNRPQTSCIRSKTVVNTVPLTISTDRSGFHFNMANVGRGVVRLDDSARMSPPLKRQKLTGTATNWSDYVPRHVVEKMEESRKNQLEIVRRRFEMIRAPIIPLEMVALVREEIIAEFPRLAVEEDEVVQERLLEYCELLVQRFGMYVEPVLTDAWQCRPSSSGLPSYIRNNLSNIELNSRSLLLNTSTNFDTRMSISRALQFPELRLIEYDCGKLQTLAVLLRQLYLYKHRCLIFTQMSKMLDVLQTFLSHHGYQYFRLDGTTGVEQRQAMMERFNADPKVFCFILSTRSGGVGVNLTGADTVIFYDSDWNPTMDAQAQDRCHRIGQTRNVSIYRLISERTIEENILRKATQKRRLGELAIDEAGFTPEFFKQSDSIRDLFDGENVEVTAVADVATTMSEKEMEVAMAKCEDEADVNAAKIAVAEANVDNAEFDEKSLPPMSNLQGDEEADEKYMELIQQLKPIERYAINFLETQYKPEFEEECKEAEALIDQKREEWDKNLNDTAVIDLDDSDSLLLNDPSTSADFYQSSSLLDEIKFYDELDDIMPIWLPPSPPDSDADFDLRMEDDCLDLMYEIEQMNEARLPQVCHEMRRPLAEKQQKQNTLNAFNDILSAKEKESVYDAVNKCLQMPQSEAITAESAASPAYTEHSSFSMDDTSQDAKIEPSLTENQQPTTTATTTTTVPQQQQQQQQQKSSKKKRNDNRTAQNRTAENGVKRATTPPPSWREEPDYDGAEWNIVEDYALLQAVQVEFANAHLVEKSANEGMVLNWEFVSNAVNKQTRFFRSARQCSIRYQMFVRPKELGQLVASDPISKKTMKVDLSHTELSHLRKGRMTTESQYAHDYGILTDKKHVNRFKSVRVAATRRPVQFWRGPKALESRNLQSLNGGMPPRHESRLAEFDVKTNIRLDAEDIVTMSDESIVAYEASKKKLLASRQTKPSPRQDVRFHTLVLRPYTVPVTTEYSAAPSRREMRIAVPPLQPSALSTISSVAAAATSGPLPSIQHLQSSSTGLGSQQNLQNSHNSEQRNNVQNMHQNQYNSSQNPPIPIRQIGAASSHQHDQGSQGPGGKPQAYHLVQQGSQQQQQQQQQATLQRRNAAAAAGSNVQFIQQQQQQQQSGKNCGQGQSFVVMGSQSSSNDGQGGASTVGGGGGGSQQPHQQQQQQPQQRIQYIPQVTGSGNNGGGGGRGGYGSTLVMPRGGRVVRPAGTLPGGGRLYVDHNRHPYPMSSNVVPVRVLPATQQGQQRMMTGQRRPAPAPGTVAAMVLPNRGAGGIPQMRSLQRGSYTGGGGQQRINVMVQPQQMRSNNGGGVGGQGGLQGGPGGPQGIRRPLVGRPLQRGVDNQAPTVAQVVVAPPQGMQQASQGPPVLHMQRAVSMQMPTSHHHQGQQQAPPQSSQQASQQAPTSDSGTSAPPRQAPPPQN
ncbi:Helicase ssl-1 [Caenorhabditis elegans]|nr:Helicase ssl-1 [Caenorhabditis elegans]CBW48565.1 Helicase ssl-1 [Caenorhabditis elegans]|eukprot:NP_001255181.1 Helicase ssl-1 [Caenorhabditis elegans]